MLFAFSGMLKFGIAASLLSLGAIDFGLVVDSSVVMIENCVRQLAHGVCRRSEQIDVVRDAALEVRKPTMFGELIIMIVYLPILTLEGIEGQLFRPDGADRHLCLGRLDGPVADAHAGAGQFHVAEPVRKTRTAADSHAQAILCTGAAVHDASQAAVIGSCTAAAGGVFGMIAPNLGSEFVPKLSEGSITMNVVRLAGTDLEETIRYNTRMERSLLENFPDEIQHVWSRVGTAEVATDPMGIELCRRVHFAQAARAVWQRAAYAGGIVGTDRAELRELAGPATGHDAANRNATE